MPGRIKNRRNKKSFLLQQLKQLLSAQEESEEILPKSIGQEMNPYLPQIREVIEEILKMRRIPYEEFIPLLVDGEDSAQCLSAAEELSRDLNRLTIATKQPAYFASFADTMYEEQGLIVEFFVKEGTISDLLPAVKQSWNVMLDFEPAADWKRDFDFGKKLYIPIFKRRWESAGNLDIAVPIGYNTVIVRGIESVKKQPDLDKFERAFYDNE